MHQTNKYLDEVQQHYTNYNMLEKVKTLCDDILSYKYDCDILIQKCKILETKARELMTASEKSLYKGKYNSKHWSSTALQHAAHICFMLKNNGGTCLKERNIQMKNLISLKMILHWHM